MEKIKILVVDDNLTATDNLTRLLGFENDFEVVGQIHTGEEGVRSYKELAPDVVLMDRRLPEMNGYQATKEIIEIDPFAQVILMSIDPGTGQARRAIKCGATDYLIYPISPDFLVAAVREAAEKRDQSPPPVSEPKPDRRPLGKIISLYSGKGGVGCTPIFLCRCKAKRPLASWWTPICSMAMCTFLSTCRLITLSLTSQAKVKDWTRN